ncbi:DUF1275 family protein [Streptomyces litchfieldiae]|uniref:DUF1275 family protein n=1 Tax=Streptomyces litchfieldiae TaxID=3075543 RepID=A0ABU2MWR0_9ACTN|nr:DUF1275 family protein [Streptomyces sp. DSM 44938]MDT0345278.1 DUF1275 family protein [Streptomyces sp. DSM 44938]
MRPTDRRSARLPLGLLLALTFATGVVDAVSYLSLGGVFAGNMTGNVIILGAALTGAGHLPTLGPAVTLAAYAAGAALAGRLLAAAPPAWGARHTALIGGVALLTAGAAPVLFAGEEPLGRPAEPLVAGVLALGMGLQAAAARQLAVKDVTTVVVTSTLTGLAADGTGGPWPRRAGAIGLLAAGAAAGAALIRLNAGWALLAGGAVMLATAVTGAAATRVKTTANRADRTG